MSSENDRLTELDQLIRTAHAELGTLQFLLINAHERELNPAELGIRIANLGRQVSQWKSERRQWSRRVNEVAQEMVSTNHTEVGQETKSKVTAAVPRRTVSVKKSISPRPSVEPTTPLGLQCG